MEQATRDTWQDIKLEAEKIKNDAERKIETAVEDVKEFLTDTNE